MTDHPIFDDLEDAVLHPVRTAENWFTPHNRTPAAMPATMEANQQEDSMSVLTEIEDGWTAAKAELAKFEQALPGALAKAKEFEASPFAVLAEKVASGILPPEAVTIAVNAANKVLDDLIGLYTPAQPAPAPAQP